MTEETEFTFNPKEIPTSSGCYLYYDENHDLLYVGKAKNLRKRVSSYFQKEHDTTRIKVMVKKIRSIETRIVGSEIEALILENNLIKQHYPRYNVLLRDDKNFVYLRITKEQEPKLEIVRRLKRDGSTYIGPKTSAKDFRDTVRFCQKHFGARMVKPGQDYYLNLVSGSEISPEEYRQNIDRMKRFLKGQTGEVVKELQQKMIDFASDKNFEAAAKIRDLIQSIDISMQKQNVEFTDLVDRDFINFYRDKQKVFFVRLTFRGGKLRDQNEVTLSAEEFESDANIVENFLLQFYEKVDQLPREIYVPCPLENMEDIRLLLLGIFQPHIEEKLFIDIACPQKGDKKKVIDIALLNAKNICEKQKIERMSQEENFSKALPELAEILGFETPPRRIEGFDVSHLQGQFPVASQVVFLDGQPKNAEYRKYNIKTLPEGKIDDYASMKEVLTRRFGRIGENTEEPSSSKKKSLDSKKLLMKPVETDEERKIYHEIRKKEIFDRYAPEIEYDPDHPDEKKKHHHPMLFLLDEEIVGVVRLDHKGKRKLLLRVFAITASKQRNGWGTQALELIEAYALEQERNEILLNANKNSIDFYKLSSYELHYWKGDAANPEENRPMGKKLHTKKKKWETPDLILLDGGKGQLSTVMKIFSEGLIKLPVDSTFSPEKQIIALAKKDELIYRPGKSDPIELAFESSALKLLQRIRDESHRFAIGANRKKRSKAATQSILDEVPGIGVKTKQELMKKFESVSGIRQATDEELRKVLSAKQLKSLHKYL